MPIGAKNEHDPIMASMIIVQNRVLEVIMYNKGLKVYPKPLKLQKLGCNLSMNIIYFQMKISEDKIYMAFEILGSFNYLWYQNPG